MIKPVDLLRARKLLDLAEVAAFNASVVTTDMPADMINESHQTFSRVGHEAGFSSACNFILLHPEGESIRNLIRAKIVISTN